MTLDRDYLNIVAFITKRRGDGSDRPIGTGFLVTYRHYQDGHRISFPYLVTAAHVVRRKKKDETFHVRLRRQSGEVFEEPIPKWTFHRDERCDVAVSLFYDATTEHKDFDLRLLPMDFAVDAVKWKVELGDRVYFMGLLSHAKAMADAGIPMVRSGTIGALYQDDLPVEFDGIRSRMHGHLMDCFAYAGFSGSPCLVQREGRWPATIEPSDGSSPPARALLTGSMTLLLGLHSAHFPTWAGARRRSDRSLDDTWDIPVNAGVGIITPVEAIRETLEQPELMADRTQRAKEALRELDEDERRNAAIPDAVTEPNEFTKEDFVVALKKSSRRQSGPKKKGK